MDCFKTRLQLRQYRDEAGALDNALFDHLWFCRGCRAYAYYLWHQQAEAARARESVAPATRKAWLENAWRERERPAARPLVDAWRAPQSSTHHH